MKSTLVRNGVRAAMTMGAVTSLGTAQVAYAQDAEEEAADLGRTVVTGSRIKKLDVETAKPVTVITRQDIELSGQPTVADVLRNTTFNSYGEFRENSGNSFGGQALVGLKGLGSTRTLVLLNGRRIPRSPVTANQAIDLNTIPLEAIDRIEILTDSASAIYGSDAIGGVINLILRKDYEGMQVMGGASRPSQEGADEEFGSLVVGGTSNKGSYLFTAEVYNKDIIFSRDRPYSATNFGDGINLGSTEGISPFGNTLINVVGPWLPDPNCDNVVDSAGNQLFGGIYQDGADQFCTFAYADVAAETQRVKRQSAFLNAEYEITPDISLTYNGTYTRLEAFGRYAPAVGGFYVDLNTPGTPAEIANWPVNIPGFYVGPLKDLDLLPGPGGLTGDGLLGHRFVGLGPRDDTTINYLFDNAVIVNGASSLFDWEVVARHTQYDSNDKGFNYVNANAAVELTGQGIYNPWDPLNPSNDAAYGLMRHTNTRDIEADFTQVSGYVNFDLFELPSGPVSWAVGFDYFDEHFKDIYDAAREAGNVIGSAGNSTEGARVNYAGFFEALVPIMDNLELSVAGRSDHYNDSAGSEFSPYFSLKYTPNDWLLLRGSWGEGFRAPNMLNLYSARSFSAEPGVDIVKCRADGIDPNGPLCGQRQFNSFSGGNPSLEPELSESFNIGAVFAFDDLNLQFGVDWWNIDIEDGIAISTVQSLINLEFDGRPLPPGNQINRLPSGQINFIVRGWANLAVTEINGIDLRANYLLETSVGDFRFDLVHSQILENLQASTPLDTPEDVNGNQDAPEYRTNFNVRWNMGDHTVTGAIRHVDGYLSTAAGSIPSHTEFDLQYNYQLPWDGEISLGVENLTDEDPELDPSNDSGGPFLTDLYSYDGRVPYFFYRQRF